MTETVETVTLPGLETAETPELVPTPAVGHWLERGPQKRLMVFSGRSHPDLAQAIARQLGVELGEIALETFANGESYCRYLESIRGEDVVSVSPDAGRAKMAVRFSEMIEGTFAIMHKTRPAHDVAEVAEITGRVRDKIAILGDDVIMTGGTLLANVAALREHGAQEVWVFATHGLFSEGALGRAMGERSSGSNGVILAVALAIAALLLGIVLLKRRPRRSLSRRKDVALRTGVSPRKDVSLQKAFSWAKHVSSRKGISSKQPLEGAVRRGAAVAEEGAHVTLRWAFATAQRSLGLTATAPALARRRRVELAWYLTMALFAAGIGLVVTVWLNGA